MTILKYYFGACIFIFALYIIDKPENRPARSPTMPVYRFEKYLLYRAFSEVYHGIGNGFSKSVYLEALATELELHNIPYIRSPELMLTYKSVPLNQFYVPDFLCFDKILVMIKASRLLSCELIQQFSNSVNMTSQPAGYLVNFGAFPRLQCFFDLSTPPLGKLSDSDDSSIDKSLSSATLKSSSASPAESAASQTVQSASVKASIQTHRQPVRIITKHSAPPAKSKST